MPNLTQKVELRYSVALLPKTFVMGGPCARTSVWTGGWALDTWWALDSTIWYFQLFPISGWLHPFWLHTWLVCNKMVHGVSIPWIHYGFSGICTPWKVCLPIQNDCSCLASCLRLASINERPILPVMVKASNGSQGVFLHN